MFLKGAEEFYDEHGTEIETFIEEIQAGNKSARAIAEFTAYNPTAMTHIRTGMRYKAFMSDPDMAPILANYIHSELHIANDIPLEQPLEHPFPQPMTQAFIMQFWPELDEELDGEGLALIAKEASANSEHTI